MEEGGGGKSWMPRRLSETEVVVEEEVEEDLRRCLPGGEGGEK